MTRKVLIITYYWPPGGGAGVQRWLKFVKYLPSCGWTPVVFTALNGEMPVVDASLEKDIPAGTTVLRRPIWEPYALFKLLSGRKKDERINASFLSENKAPGMMERVGTFIRGNFFIPDARRFWIRPSAKFLERYLRENAIDTVISSGPPHSMHLIALRLKRRMPHLKWVADFRDPWTNIDFYDKLMLTRWADRAHRRLELAVLRGCDAVIGVGHTLVEELKTIYLDAGGTDKDKFSVIPNGYDDEDFSGTAQRYDGFVLSHIGTLVKDRNPLTLWRVLQRLVENDKDFASRLQIRLVGKADHAVKQSIEDHGLKAYTRQVAYLPHAEVMGEQAQATALLLLVNRTRNARGIVTGKLYEYLASGTPVLAIGPPDGDAARVLGATGGGMISDFDDDAVLEANIRRLYAGDMPARDAAAIRQYSRRSLTNDLCALLGRLRPAAG